MTADSLYAPRLDSSEDLLSPVWTHLTRIQPVRAAGAELFDADGRAWLDFTSGIGVVNTGHCHPHVVKAVQAQASQLLFGQMNCVISPPVVRLVEMLDDITPSAIDRFFFSNSGAEATEACVKLAKAATGRTNVIVFQGSFHGRTHLAMAMTTSKTVYRHRYQPLPAGIFVAPFPYAYRYGWPQQDAVAFCLKELDLLLKGQTAPDETAAIIIEPVLGEGGYVPAPASFLQGLREVCDRHGILLIIDEVQSGFGRTGSMFCFETSGVEPDILVMAKGLGSGLPISAVGARAELMERWTPGTHGGTYGGGSAVAAAAACATIEVMLEEDLPGNAARRGEQLRAGLRALQGRFAGIGDVRGPGLMVATEFSRADGSPDAETAGAVARACVERGLLLLTCGSYGNVVRWIPPLVVSEAQVADALERFAGALEQVGTAG